MNKNLPKRGLKFINKDKETKGIKKDPILMRKLN